IALKRAPGKIEGAELEHEHGKFIYSFDIRAANGTIMEVHVSAISGKVVSVAEESSQHETTEQKKEPREHAPAHRDHGARAQ
ncbi:MAG: PepSY domain-containing protein, partial [Burkholderiales bacterium]